MINMNARAIKAAHILYPFTCRERDDLSPQQKAINDAWNLLEWADEDDLENEFEDD